MSITIESLRFIPASCAVSSRDIETTEPTLVVTLSGINDTVFAAKDDASRYLALCIAHPSLSSHMKLITVETLTTSVGESSSSSDDGNRLDQRSQASQLSQLQLTYAGKGSIRALLRSLTDTSNSAFQVSEVVASEASRLLNEPLLSPTRRGSPVVAAHQPNSASSSSPTSSLDVSAASPSRPVYQPEAPVAATCQSINPVEGRTIAGKPYIVAAYPGARRRLSDFIASVAEVTHRLSEKRTPRSTVFQDDNGYRRAVGSDFKPQAVTLHDKLLSLASDERAAFLTAHAGDLGECLALMTYIDQADFHLNNIMIDTETDRWFIIDFDKCYNTQTHKYHSAPVTSDDFSKISQRDLCSPLNPVDRYTDNWFYLQQTHISGNSIHTLSKLQLLPGLNTLLETDAFKLAYFTSLYACACLRPDQLQACTQQIANPIWQEKMVQDFSARSQTLRQQLFSMPEFIACYQKNSDVFEARIVALRQDDITAPEPRTLEQFKQEVNQAIIAKVESFEVIVGDLEDQLKQAKDRYESAVTTRKRRKRAIAEIEYQHERAHLHHCAELELKGIEVLVQWLAQQDPKSETMLTKMNSCKNRIIQRFNDDIRSSMTRHASARASSSEPSVDTSLLEMSEVVRAKRRVMQSMTKYSVDAINVFKKQFEQEPSMTEKLTLFWEYTQALKASWEKDLPALCLLEAHRDPYLIELTQQLTQAITEYMQMIQSMQQRIVMAAFSSASLQVKQNARNQLEHTKSLLNNLRLAGWLNELDWGRARNQLQHHIIGVFYGEIHQDLLVIPRDVHGQVVPQRIIDNVSMLTAVLQGFRAEDKPEKRRKYGQLLNDYANTQNYPLADNGLALADSLLNYMEAYPLAEPALPPSYDLASLTTYSVQYETMLNDSWTRTGWVRQLKSYYEQLEQLAWITPEVSAERTNRLTTLKTNYTQIDADYASRANQARIRLIQFKNTYDAAEGWHRGLSLFGQRPGNMEQQHAVYQQYVAGQIISWATWVGVHGIGCQAVTQESFISQAYSSLFGSSLRDDRAQTFYTSFPATPTDVWMPPEP